MKDKKSNNWSIQISSKTASALKSYCDENGLKMNWFVDTAIHLCISGSLIITCVKAHALRPEFLSGSTTTK